MFFAAGLVHTQPPATVQKGTLEAFLSARDPAAARGAGWVVIIRLPSSFQIAGGQSALQPQFSQGSQGNDYSPGQTLTRSSFFTWLVGKEGLQAALKPRFLWKTPAESCSHDLGGRCPPSPKSREKIVLLPASGWVGSWSLNRVQESGWVGGSRNLSLRATGDLKDSPGI